MITNESTVNATYGKSFINNIFGGNPWPQERLKPSETAAMPTIPDNDAEIASIDPNPLREELAGIPNNLRQNSGLISATQNYRQLLATLTERRDQTKELSQLQNTAKDKTGQQQPMWKRIEASNKQINDIVDIAPFGGNKIFTAAEQDMAISVGDDSVINIPAKDLGVNLIDADLNENPDTLLEKVKREIQVIMDNGRFLLGVKVKTELSTTLMEYELGDLLTFDEYMADKNMALDLAKLTTSQVLQDMHKALRGQANVSPEAAAALLINTN